MTKTKFLLAFIVSILCISSCKSNNEPEFYYIENMSDEDVTISYSSENITVKAKSNVKIDTLEKLQYSLKSNKTIIAFNDSASNKNYDIDYLNATLGEGFHDGNYCYILRFRNSFPTDYEYKYSFFNSRNQDIEIYFSVFGIEDSLTLEPNKEIECTFKYRVPNLKYNLFFGNENHEILENHRENKDNITKITL